MSQKDEAIVNDFNAAHQLGTPVLYRSHPGAEPRKSTTRSEAWILGGHTPVVLIEGIAGGVALSHIDVIRVIRE